MGASIFYHSPPESETQKSDDVSALDSELKSGAKNVKEAEKEQQNLSSLVKLIYFGKATKGRAHLMPHALL